MGKRFRIIALFGICTALLLALCSCAGSGAAGQTGVSARAGDSTSESVSKSVSGDVPKAMAMAAAPSTCGKLHVEGTRLVGEGGQPVQLRGASTHGLAWFPAYVNDRLFGELRVDWGANVVRMAMYTAEGGGYCADGDKAQLRKLVDDGVKYATDNDLYVIVDWHILSDNNPNLHVDEAEKFFADVSAAYADHDNVLYEICNEPNGGATWADVKAYAERVIPVIRANSPDAVIIVGTPTWSQDVDAAAADPLAAENVMYALHFYAATHKDDLRGKAAKALDAGLPLFVTEFGICDASGNGAIDEVQADEWIAFLNDRGVSYVMWNLSNKAESSAMFKVTCDKVSGFQDSDLSQAGAWLKRTLADEDHAASSKALGNSVSAVSSSAASVQALSGIEDVRVNGDFEYSVKLRDSWVANGESYYLYDLVLVNDGAAVDSWEIDVPFNADVKLSDNWNGSFQVDGSVVHIANAAYNGAVASGGSVSDVGFIAAGPSSLELV